jgi:plastocyanin
LFRKQYVTLVCAVTLLLLAVAPVYAAPSLGLGSTASYNLTGKIQASQNCTAIPANYTLQACFGIAPPLPPPPPPTVTVWIEDNGICQTNEPSCQFAPAAINASQGSTIIWKNNGTLVHTVTVYSNSTVPTINSGSIAPKGNFSYTFKFGGTYHYYDPLYTWMKGTINIPIIFVALPALPVQIQPISRPMQVDLSGTVGWKVEGLSGDQANLNVSHQIGLSVSPFPGFSLTPITESGSFEQSINLSTRVESPGTAASIVKSFLVSALPALSGTTFLTGATTVTNPILQAMLSGQSASPEYTTWWVNGPLSNGSPLQILHGWSSVTGSESLNLGSIGTRAAWIVTSQLSQTINLNIPNPSNPFSPTTSNAAASLKLLWSYDMSADLLLRNDNTVDLTMHSVTPTNIGVPTPCGQYICYNPVQVTVTRNMALTVNLALLLSSTNLSLPKSPSHTSTLMDLLSVVPWMPLGLAGLAAGVAVVAVVWFTQRAKSATLPGPVPTASQPSSPSAPS